MNYIVVGCGRVGAELAYRLFKGGHKVSVIDRSAGAFNDLPADFRGRTVEGEGLERDVLHRAGIEQADGVVTVTNSDSVNAVVAYLARTVYDVRTVVVRNYDSRRRSLHEMFGLQVVSPASWGAQRMEELLYEKAMHTVFSAGNGEVEIYEFMVPDAWHGHSLEDLLSAIGECVPVALTRAGRAMLPNRDVLLEEGDVVHLSATAEGIRALCQRLDSPQEGFACSY